MENWNILEDIDLEDIATLIAIGVANEEQQSND
jgi:hypothetical protein